MDTALIFLLFFFIVVYTIYYFSTAKYDIEYKKTFIVFDDKVEPVYYCVDFVSERNGTETYYLKDDDPFDSDFYVVVYVRNLGREFYKLNYFTHFGLSRVKKEDSFLAKILKMEPKNGRKEIMNLITQIKEQETCPYKIK